MWTRNNITDQSGKTIIVAGGNSGIGYQTVLALYQVGANVIVACRDSYKAKHAIVQIKKDNSNGSLEVGILDLVSL